MADKLFELADMFGEVADKRRKPAEKIPEYREKAKNSPNLSEVRTQPNYD